VNLTSVWSRDCWSVDVVTLTGLVGKSISSSVERSDGLGSPVECPPLSSVIWVGVLDSESELVSTDVLSVEEGSVGWHQTLDLELDSISEWISWEVRSSWVEPPSLVSAVVAFVPNNISVVGV